MLNCYIVDDEQQAIDGLIAMMQVKFPERVRIIGSTTDARKAIHEIDQLKPDLLFLDVEMPMINGLELLKHFPERKFQVIFTTAHEKYALPALKAAASDYLIKPFSPQEVADALQKCMEQSNANNKKPKLDVVPRLSLAASNEIVLVDIPDIIRVEGQNNYSHFYFSNRPKLIVSKTLREYETLLTPYHFFRVHQSHLVNLTQIASIQSNDGDYLLLKNGDRVEVSRRRKSELMQKLNL